MRYSFLLLLLLAVTSGAADNSMVIAPATKGHSGCNLSVAGFKSRDQFLHFFAALQAASKSSDKVKLADLAIYPLSLNFGEKRYGQVNRKIRDKKDFINQFQSFFSKKVYDAIEFQKAAGLFCNSQGVMLGNGAVWIAPRGNAVGIITINN
jgi:hypothetical protein